MNREPIVISFLCNRRVSSYGLVNGTSDSADRDALVSGLRARVGGFYFANGSKSDGTPNIVPCYEGSGDNGYATLDDCNAARDHYVSNQTKATAHNIFYLGLGALVGGLIGYFVVGSTIAAIGGAVVGAIPIGIILDLSINGFQPGDMM